MEGILTMSQDEFRQITHFTLELQKSFLSSHICVLHEKGLPRSPWVDDKDQIMLDSIVSSTRCTVDVHICIILCQPYILIRCQPVHSNSLDEDGAHHCVSLVGTMGEILSHVNDPKLEGVLPYVTSLIQRE
jgi:hypothetical protein